MLEPATFSEPHVPRRAWYPVSTSAIDDGPRPLELFGEPLLLWRHRAEWVVTERFCPHAGADLAIGRLGDSGLVCPFHGATFGTRDVLPEGDCPPLKRYPVVQRDLNVWVWPGVAQPRWQVPQLGGAGSGWEMFDSRRRIVGASVAELFENVVDEGHFAHVHGAVHPPVLRQVEITDQTLHVETLHRAVETGPGMLVRLRADGPGAAVVEFGRVPWLRVVATHTPIELRRTDVRWRVEVQPNRQLNKELAGSIVGALAEELRQDDEIWTRRDWRIDRRSSPSLVKVRRWLATFSEGR